MSRIRRELSRKKLTRFLAAADDEAFCSLVWAVDAIQSNREVAGARILKYKPEAVTSDIRSPWYVKKWSLETLINELLVTPKSHPKKGRFRYVDCHQFDAIAEAINVLYDLEDAEDGIALNRITALDELTRIGHRQFEWQRGIDNIVHLYRSVHLFGGPLATAAFAANNNITLAQFVFCGFATYTHFGDNAQLTLPLGIPEFDVTPETFRSAQSLLGQSIQDARRSATALRSRFAHVAYKPSVLRQRPCIAFQDGRRIRAPLRDLVLRRVTSGLYYDVVGADDGVRSEIGKRFENYCLHLIRPTWPEVTTSEEFEYGPNKANQFRSPDLLLSTTDGIHIVAECKAKRMPISARFGEDPLQSEEAKRGLDEVAKGIFQIWRFFGHVRRGLIPDIRMHSDAMGLVLTLDPWLSVARGRYAMLLSKARELAHRDRAISEDDLRPIAFCPIEDLELLLRKSTFSSFLATIRAATTDETASWHLPLLREHKNLVEDVDMKRPYPFTDRIGDLLPWWNRLVRR